MMSEPSSLFQWSTPYVGRRISKEKFYEHSADARKLKENFVREVERVTWAHRLDPDSLNLDGSDAVPEILILEVEAKGDDVSEEVLAAIDAAIPHPIIFEVLRSESMRPEARTAAVMRLPGARTSACRHFTSRWCDAQKRLEPLPVALSLEGLYLRILGRILEVPARSGEDFGGYRVRVAEIERCRREVERLGRRIRAERQFNRRVELNGQKKDAGRRLEALLAPEIEG
ncbi:DUF4391 domain-containing protein [Schaalia hyovaginalis]|uniref:DUF4391 domain-containing protein n=1 Tax=Schaalia hyovaginalis TaxID=29316 RepID=UPI0026F0BE6A|nr:DUF4391 domain-containing protein [Schaalia hyovaginalis]MCI7513325.1 DUF4391 domain-containing protein [Schaalia hyovaginalis]